MFNFMKTKIEDLIKIGAESRISDEEFIVKEIKRFKMSRKRKMMVDGKKYYEGDHDILRRERTVIGQDGNLETVKNLPNNRIVDNQYKKMVNQKNNYLLGKPFSISCENEQYANELNRIFNNKFKRRLLNVGKTMLNQGIAWLFPYYDENGEFAFKLMDSTEVIPGWADAEHTKLDYVIRLYEVIAYEGKEEKVIENVEIYTESGIDYFKLDGNTLTPIEPYHKNYFSVVDGKGVEEHYNWSKLPFIPFKYNAEEIPLIKMIKSLQDGLNLIESNFQNQMEEDVRNTILVLVNYDGENLGEFRKNLATYGAVKVKTVDGAGGDLKTLEIEVNSENYKTIIELFKKAIIENAMGYDAKDDRMSGTPNQMNIQSMYSDIDLDANNMETELQASFEELLWFINVHLFNTGVGNFENEEVDIIFDRDILINEGEVIDNISKSEGILSKETLIKNHPWIDDPQEELEKLEGEKQKEIEQYDDAFNPTVNVGGEVANGENE